MKHEEKYCPGCGTRFECKAGTIDQCQCTEIRLNIEERAFIEEKGGDCYCIKCLERFKVEYERFKEKFIFSGSDIAGQNYSGI